MKRVGLVAGLWAGLLVQPVVAADYTLKTPNPLPVAAAASGFYVTVGAELLFASHGTIKSAGACGDPTLLIPCGAPTSVDTPASGAVFAGVGYRFNPWLRGELHLGYGTTSVTATVGPVPAAGFFGNRTVDTSFNAWTGMALAYLDFAGMVAPGTFGAFEPYVGVGIGLSRNELSTLTLTNTAVPNTVFWHPGGTHWDFAWAVTIGTGIRLSHWGAPRGWLVDIAYRFIDLGDIVTGSGPTLFQTAGGPVFTGPFRQGLNTPAMAHGVALALRYEFQ